MGKSKLVVRRLPPDIDPKVFFSSIHAGGFTFTPLCSELAVSIDASMCDKDGTIEWVHWHQGRIRASPEWTRPSLAHLKFSSEENALRFVREFTGRTFSNAAGDEQHHRCVIEWALNQEVPSFKPTRDSQSGLISSGIASVLFVSRLIHSDRSTVSAVSKVDRSTRNGQFSSDAFVETSCTIQRTYSKICAGLFHVANWRRSCDACRPGIRIRYKR